MRNILTIKFGSHLYGTSTPASDVDYKSVFIPSARDIILQRVKGTVTTHRQKAIGEKNYAGEVDIESHSLQRFLQLAADGQTVALDVLFSPDWAMVEPCADEWREIMAHRHRLLTKKSASFVGYVRTQSNKYGIKGSRVAAARGALELLTAAIEVHGTTAKLEVVDGLVTSFVKSHEFTTLMPIENTGTKTIVMHWEVCGRKMPYAASIKNAWGIMKAMVDEYGKRALMAETQQGVDWKALSHAVRIGTQALELLETGNITFPLPNAQHVIDIKTGKLLYRDVADEIEDFLVRVELAAGKSKLQNDPDHEWIDKFVERVYRAEISKPG